MMIIESDLSVRAKNALKRNGIQTIQQASKLLESGKLKTLPGIGKRTLEEIEGTGKISQCIVINEIAPGLNGSDGLIREHYRDKRKRKERYMWLIRQQNPKKHSGKVRLTYTRVCVRKMDWDNLAASFKHWGDALTDLGIIEDDNPDVIVDFRPKWKKAKGYKSQKTIIEIEDV